LVFPSNRPTYAVLLVALFSLWMCALFLPLLFHVVFPNEGIQGVVYALEQRQPAPPEAVAAVQGAIAAAGPLIRAIPVAYYSGVTTTVGVNGSQTSRAMQATYIAWFERRSGPLLLLITRYQDDGGRLGYAINEGQAWLLIRGYTPPVVLFGVSLFLARKRKPPASSQ
jgi:hypothetical protein